MEICSFSPKLDRVSNLPVEVKDIILTCLCLQEAVRTSILSTKWRYSWINLSKLRFDDTIFQFSKETELITRYKLIAAINHILLLRDGPVLEFSLSHSVLESCPEIDHFTIFLFKKRVHAFSLNILKGKMHRLHSSFFSCQELTHIDLSKFIFNPPPSFNGFPKLIRLKFVNVIFSSEFVENFNSSCPQLESLTLINPPKFQCLALSALNLKFLHLKGKFGLVCLGDVPLLQSASFALEELDGITGDVEKCTFVAFLCCMPSLKKLVANFRLLVKLADYSSALKKLPTSLSLETLELSSISFDRLDEVTIIFSLINSCPGIKRIEIKIYENVQDQVDKVLDFLKGQDFNAYLTLDELQEVHLTCVSGIEPELQFIKLLLAKSPALKMMLIKTKEEDDSSRLKLLRKLTRFQRASTMAEIIYE